MMEPKSRDELFELYGNDSTTSTLREFLDIRHLLGTCIIDSQYRVDREMHESLTLTPLGERMREAFTKKGIKYPEARFICFLEVFQKDLLIDLNESSYDKLASVVSEEIRSRKILFPYTYGRLLYDKLNAMPLRAGRSVLTASETQEVLAGTPQGVFQMGRYVTGPYGLLLSNHRRMISPRDSVPYHCADIRCTETHDRTLVSDSSAAINQARSTAVRMLDKDSHDHSDWRGFFERSGLRASDPYDDLSGDCIPFLLGDSLALSELRSLVAWLLDHTGNEVRQVATKVGIRPAQAAQMTAGLGEAELLQLVLMASNKDIFSGLDHLVRENLIPVPPGEVRRPVVNADVEVGTYALKAELGRFGVRIRSDVYPLAPLRLKRLVGQMYRLDDEADRQDLEWQLRGEESANLEAKIESYLQNGDPSTVISALLLARRSNFIVASSHLGLAEDNLRTDEDRVNAVMWKLGFPVEGTLDPHRSFWNLFDTLNQSIRQSPLTLAPQDVDRIRGHAGAFFPVLESVLRDSLFYVTWALTTDHPSTARPFVYRPHIDEEYSRLRLDEAGKTTNVDHQVRFTEKTDLYALMRGYQLLADILDQQSIDSESYLRPNHEIPDWAIQQELQKFAFNHTSPYLDLLPESQKLILKNLRGISTRLISTEAYEARNEWAHGRQGTPNLDILKIGMDAIREAVIWIEDAGFSRQIFRRVRSVRDEADRSTVVLANKNKRELAFHRPSMFGWLDMPPLSEPQHVLSAARFAEPNEVLRFQTESDSPFSRLWRDYPVRTGDPSTSINSQHSHVTQARQ
ncbi:hypothetical protein O7623_09045 [Solwaraspora sp. WMMD791]|uniref:hypothetical protein n=1 Tax=Solwaraspora sp. WMMD791 TaxID=3016086 RepID=UPI00249AB32F|nr:hypothetical protein [Solwaraspora sp. WMMD791]WFE29317.1 hypothetical protein O7623_09045 [Solwaraspora sp. WMMD791]